MKRIVLASLSLLIPFLALSQNESFLITGRVIDAVSQEALPFANVVYDQLGTSTNPEGEFILLIESTNDESKLLVKYIGYQSQEISLDRKSKNLVVKLDRSNQHLENITVYSAEHILKDVNNYHQINYEFKDQFLSTYYKESVNSPNNCSYLAEGIFDIYLPTIYSKEKATIEAKKTRKKEFVSLDTLGIPMFNGHASDMIQSATRRKDSFLDVNEMENYFFSKEDVTVYDGKEVIIITFEPKNKKGTSRGTLYIDSESKAIIKTEYYPVLENQYFWTNVMWTEEYVEVAGTWYVHRVSYTGTWDHFGTTYTYNALLVVTDFETVLEKPQMNALDEQAIFFKEATGFSDDFWDDHNYIKLTVEEKGSFVQASPH